MPKVGVLKRGRKPDEFTTARVAIRAHCLECVNYLLEEVKLCTAPACWLYSWRLGKTPTEIRAKREPKDLTPAQQAARTKFANQRRLKHAP